MKFGFVEGFHAVILGDFDGTDVVFVDDGNETLGELVLDAEVFELDSNFGAVAFSPIGWFEGVGDFKFGARFHISGKNAPHADEVAAFFFDDGEVAQSLVFVAVQLFEYPVLGHFIDSLVEINSHKG